MNEISLDTYRKMSDVAAWFRTTDKTLKSSNQILVANFKDETDVVFLDLEQLDSPPIDEGTQSDCRVRMDLHKAIRADAEKYSFPREVMEEIVNPFILRATENLMRERKPLDLKTCDKIIKEYDNVLQSAKEAKNGNVSGLHVQGGKGKNLSPKVASGNSNSKAKVATGNSNSKAKVASGNSSSKAKVASGNSNSKAKAASGNYSDILNMLNSNVKAAGKLPKKAKKIVKSVSSKIGEKASQIGQKFSTNMLTGAFVGKFSSGKKA